ncbi:MAG: hypothetical protein ABL982_20500 [Vicinamibacterales bacterium]
MNSVTFLHLNDLHGYLSPHAEIFDMGRQRDARSGGGLSRIPTLFRNVRREVDGAVVALDNGDTLHGTMDAVRTQGEALIAPMGALEALTHAISALEGTAAAPPPESRCGAGTG